MRSTISLAALFAATVLASPQPAEHVEIVQIREIIHRQFSGVPSISLPVSFDINTIIPSACLFPTTLPPAPTLPADLQSAYLTWSDPCHAITFTGSQSAEYSSYLSAASSYAKSIEPLVKSFLSQYSTACPLATQVPSLSAPTAFPSLALGSLSLVNCGTQPTGPAGGPSDAGGKPSSAMAAQPTGFAKAAGVLAGVAGIVAAL